MKKIILMGMLFFAQAGHSIELQTGLNGSWYQPEQFGQGFVLHIIPDGDQIFIAWFTYEENGGKQQWMTAHGNLQSNPINLEIIRSTGGSLNSGAPQPNQSPWGSGSIEFTSCTTAVFNFNGESSGSIELIKLAAPINCSEA